MKFDRLSGIFGLLRTIDPVSRVLKHQERGYSNIFIPGSHRPYPLAGNVTQRRVTSTQGRRIDAQFRERTPSTTIIAREKRYRI